MIFDLVRDFTDMLDAMPTAHPRRGMVKLINEAIRRDVNFINRHPTTLFQCLWNTGWWYDNPEAEKHYEEPEDGGRAESPPWQRPKPKRCEVISRAASKFMTFVFSWRRAKPKLCELLDQWRGEVRRPDTAVKLPTLARKVLGLTRNRPGRSVSFRFWIRSIRPPALPLGSAQLAQLIGHTDWVHSVAFSPDGRRIVSGSRDGTVQIWDSNTGEPIARITGNTTVNCLAFSANGRLIAGGFGDGTVWIWDGNSGTTITRLTVDEHGGP